MIPPLMGSTPVPDSTDQPGEGFANAMAAALVMAPPPPATPPPASTGQDVASCPEPPIPPGSTLTVPAPAPFTTMPDQIARLATPTLPEYGAVAGQVADSIVTSAGNPTPVATAGNPTQVATPAGPVPLPATDLERIERTPPPADLGMIERTPAPEDVEMIEPPLAPTEEPAAVVTPEVISELTTAEATAEVPRPAVVTLPTAPPRAESPTTLARPVVEATASTATAPNGPRPDVPVAAEAATPQGAAPPASATTLATSDRISVPDARRAEFANHVEPDVSEPVETNTVVAATEPAPGHTSGVSSSESNAVPSSVLRRVEEAVRRLENAPPPRTITITVDDHGLHRVTVSLMSDGVKLSVPDGAATDPQLVSDMERALESRGFDMSGRQRRRSPDQTDDATDFVPTQAQTRRTDAGYRL